HCQLNNTSPSIRFSLHAYIELGIQTEEEMTKLAEWKKYRVALNRIDTSTAPDIVWPEIPA
ncbi:MAG: tail fiber assembly protein, partial [[Clostridium] symbiosum]